MWNIERGIIQRELSVGTDVKETALHMQWRDSKVVIATCNRRVQIWQYVGSSLTLLNSWNAETGGIKDMDFNEK